jgi:hypothetical protein
VKIKTKFQQGPGRDMWQQNILMCVKSFLLGFLLMVMVVITRGNDANDRPRFSLAMDTT